MIPKGLYARAQAGELKGLTGIDDPYEVPRRPDLRVSDAVAVPAAVDALLDLLAGTDEPAASNGAGLRPHAQAAGSTLI